MRLNNRGAARWRFDAVDMDYESLGVGKMKVGERGLRGLWCEHRATVQHRNLIMAECVLFCCLHPRVSSANIRKRQASGLALTHWLEDKDKVRV